jgi:hypothetical protein
MSEYSKALKRIINVIIKDDEYDKPDYDSILLEIPDLFPWEKELDFIKVIFEGDEEDCILLLERAEMLMEENSYVFPILDTIIDTEFLDFDLEFLDEEE